jgi:7-keto-8-aminopelargonate synthetase-like enzyme
MKTTLSVVQSLRARGIYACPSFFPAVPKSRTGIRFTVSLHNELADIDALIVGLRETLSAAGVHPASTVGR